MSKKFELYTYTFILTFLAFSKNVFAASDCSALGNIMDTINKVWYIMLIAGPIVLIVMSLVDIAKTIMSGEDGAFKKCLGRIVKRVIATIILILLPIIITFVLNQAGVNSCVPN